MGHGLVLEFGYEKVSLWFDVIFAGLWRSAD